MNDSLRFPQDFKKAASVLVSDLLLLTDSTGYPKYTDFATLKALFSAFAAGQVVPRLVNPGDNLGSPLTVDIAFGSAGSYTTPAGSLTTTEALNIFIWDKTSWSFIGIPIDLTDYAKSSDLTSLAGKAISGVQSTFAGKTIYCLGDSFTELNLYQQKLIDKLGVKIVSDGIGGSCITGNTANAEGDGHSRTPIVDRIDAALATNPDIIIIEGGSNDWYYSTALGDIDSTDRNTYYGAWKEILTKCASAQYPLMVVPVTMMQRASGTKAGGAAGRGNYYPQWARVNAVLQLGDLFGFQVCNVFNNSGITFENILVYTTDYVHPDKTAGKEKFSSFVANFIYQLGFLQTFGFSSSVSNEDVVWTNLQEKTIVSGNTIRTNNGTNVVDWIAGGNANKKLVAGNGSIDIPGAVADAYILGFGKAPLYAVDITKGQYNYQQLSYGAYYNGQTFRAFENGTSVFQLNGLSGAKPISIKIDGGVAKYYFDGNLVYTSTQAVSYPLYPAISMNQLTSTSTSVSGAKISGDSMSIF